MGENLHKLFISLQPDVVELISDGLNILRLKYLRSTPSSCKDIGIRQFESVADSFNLAFNWHFRRY